MKQIFLVGDSFFLKKACKSRVYLIKKWKLFNYDQEANNARKATKWQQNHKMNDNNYRGSIHWAS